MTTIEYAGKIYNHITKEEWMFAGGETNPDLLKLRHPKRERRCYRYFRISEFQPKPKEEVPEETEYDKAMRKWRESGKLD